MNRSASASAERALPCLNSNNCIETENLNKNNAKQIPIGYEKFLPNECKPEFNEFSTSHKKSSCALEMNVHQFIETFGLNHVGFLTLTFSDDVQEVKEAQRRFHSLRTNFLKKHFEHYICVYERMKSGRIHFHLIVNTREDIRRGLNFKQIQARNYTSANKALRQLWQILRENMDKRPLQNSFFPNSQNLTQDFGCFCFKYPLIPLKYPLNLPWIPINQASDCLLGGSRRT